MKIFGHTSDRSRYEAGAIAFGCFDDRFQDTMRLFVSRFGANIDFVSLAGVVKDLAHAPEAIRDYLLGQVAKSAKLHKTRRVILLGHRECGCYEDETFEVVEGSIWDPERNCHHVDLEKAKLNVSKRFPDFLVDSFFVDFDGIHDLTPPHLVRRPWVEVPLFASKT